MKTAKTYLDSIFIYSNYAQMEGISLSSSTSASLKSVLHQSNKQKCFKQSFTVISLQKIVSLTIKKTWMFIITKLHRSRSIYRHISNLFQTWFLDSEESYSYLWKKNQNNQELKYKSMFWAIFIQYLAIYNLYISIQLYCACGIWFHVCIL